jgi:hypothetical protein
MAKHKYPWMALSKLLNSKTELSTADAAGEYLHIVCITAGQWETLHYRGTWGVEG